MTLRIGSLCSGYGGLDLAAESVLGGELAWYAQYEPPDAKGRPDKHQYAARIMAHHWPGVPNHGDITVIDYTTVEPVDIVTAGFPCQPVSNAGHRKGQADARWIWPHVARAVRDLRPRLVLLENVAVLTRRGLDTVIGDLAEIRFDAEWVTLPASDVGAPHERKRIFILAWPSVALGVVPNPEGDRRDEGRTEPAGSSGDLMLPSAVVQLLPTPRASPNENRQTKRTPSQEAGIHGLNLAAEACLIERERGRLRDQAPADAENDGRERTGQPRRRRSGPAHHHPEPELDWGPYTAAVRHWEALMGRPAPEPTEPGRNGPVLSPALPEWMMGLPAGWVTDVPGIPRSAQLKAIGNGVVPQQAAHALRLLLARMDVSFDQKEAA